MDSDTAELRSLLIEPVWLKQVTNEDQDLKTSHVEVLADEGTSLMNPETTQEASAYRFLP